MPGKEVKTRVLLLPHQPPSPVEKTESNQNVNLEFASESAQQAFLQ